jgi:hypothetical protein
LIVTYLLLSWCHKYIPDLRVFVQSKCNTVHYSFLVFLYWTLHVSA